MGGGPSVLRNPIYERSNTELTSSLRANFSDHRSASISSDLDQAPHPPFSAWIRQQDNTLYIPSPDPDEPGLAEDKSHYDITVKLFYLPGIPSSRRCTQTREAIDLVLRALKVRSIDLLIVSFPGISFDADDEDSDSEAEESTPASTSQDGGCADSGVPDEISTMIETWRIFEGLHDSGVIAKLGLAEFGTRRLSRFLAHCRVKPSVDQINVRDCCVVPKPLILFAKTEGIELLTHNDCTNILPKGTTRELLGTGEKGFGILASGDGTNGVTGGLNGDVEPQFVVKYTAVVKDTGVVENKGYFAEAELKQDEDEAGRLKRKREGE